MANGTIPKPSPTVFDLIPNSSLSRSGGQGTYDNGVVTFMLSVSNGANMSQSTVLGTIPEGYRPSTQKSVNCFIFTDTSRTAGLATVDTNGQIKQTETGYGRFGLIFGMYTV